MPGFVDSHIHAWEGQIAGIIPNSNGIANDANHNYFTVVHQTLGRITGLRDMYVGNLLTALSCIEAGITTFCDNGYGARHLEILRSISDVTISTVPLVNPPRGQR